MGEYVGDDDLEELHRTHMLRHHQMMNREGFKDGAIMRDGDSLIYAALIDVIEELRALRTEVRKSRAGSA